LVFGVTKQVQLPIEPNGARQQTQREHSHSRALTVAAVTNALALAVVLSCTLGVRAGTGFVADHFDPSPRTAEGDSGTADPDNGLYAETKGSLSVMFLEYYKLNDQSFGVPPDPGLLFLSPTHREALIP
jgi:hypothetical protein